jgi:hypothetical protein
LTPLNGIEESDGLGSTAEGLRRIELSESRRALDQSNLGLPHPREIQFGLRDSAGALEQNGILSVAGDFTDEPAVSHMPRLR